MSFLKEMKDVYKQAKQVVQQQQGYRDGPSGNFPQYPNSQGGYAPPPGPPPPHNPGYAPSYAPPPSGYGSPSGPPAPQGFGFPTPPSGFPSPGYTSPSGPPQGYSSPSGPPQAFNPPSGPPPGYGSSNPTQPGYPGASPRPPANSPGTGYPGQQWHQRDNSSGYPGQQYHQQHNQSPGFPNQQGHQQPPPPSSGYNPAPAMQYRPPSGPPPRPPAAIQNYGPHFQGPNHQDAQPYFQYSQCTGKKKALCIGINYVGQQGELKGCINDARNIQRFLCHKFGYKSEDIVMLTDDAQNPRMRPTKVNIIEAMRWLVNGAAPNDSLFFHYSGHGGQTKDLDGDEGDGYDEVVYPLDFKTNGHIVDDMMHDIMVKPLPAGCRLTAIFDSCHSGSALDLPYIYSTEGKIKEPNLAAEAGQGLLSAVSSYARGDMGGVFKSAMGLVKVASGNTAKADKYAKETKTSPADVISWSGCKDSQTSADTHEAGQATGAMSFAFMTVLDAKPQQSYQELLVNIRDILRAKYSQKPQLSSSHPMDTNIMFIC